MLAGMIAFPHRIFVLTGWQTCDVNHSLERLRIVM
jgi:hypothetical protein